MTPTVPRRAFLLGIAATLSTAPRALAQPRPPLVHALDVFAGYPPTPVNIGGRRHLGYELHITNLRASDVTLVRIDVLDARRGTQLAAFSGAALGDRLGHPGAAPNSTDRRLIAPGLRAVAYFWLPLDDEVATPDRLQHRIVADVAIDSRQERVVMMAGETEVRRDEPIALDPPLRGGPWLALYDPLLVGSHRTAIYALDGRARIPARFAIDWVRLERDGTHARGDATRVANWYGYGTDVLAVADGTVADVRDDMAEEPSIAAAQGPVPLENVSGNYVTLDLGRGRYAFYEHLKHRSLRVKNGDRVRAGQVLASLGNSGSSSAGPHLHFHVADANAELAAEGLPFVFKAFEVIGGYRAMSGFTTEPQWAEPPGGAGGPRRGELPAANAVVLFS